MTSRKAHPAELRERAVAMVFELRAPRTGCDGHAGDAAATSSTAPGPAITNDKQPKTNESNDLQLEY